MIVYEIKNNCVGKCETRLSLKFFTIASDGLLTVIRTYQIPENFYTKFKQLSLEKRLPYAVELTPAVMPPRAIPIPKNRQPPRWQEGFDER